MQYTVYTILPLLPDIFNKIMVEQPFLNDPLLVIKPKSFWMAPCMPLLVITGELLRNHC
jgi:hypothetical protein